MTSTPNPEVMLPGQEPEPGHVTKLPAGVEPRDIPVPIQQTPPAVHKPYFTRQEVELIKTTICKGATDDELKLFLFQCERTGLNPFMRQIYSLQRREQRDGEWVNTRSIQVSIDGLRLVAERSGKYAGQVGPFWCGEDGDWRDIWLEQDAPVAARVGILRKDFSEPCWGVAKFDSYAPRKRDGTLPRMWHVMGDVMVAKCAEANGLRKAFPQECSGLYTMDEMEQAGSDVVAGATSSAADTVTPEQIEQMEILLKAGRKDIRKRFFEYVSKLLNSTITELKDIPQSHFKTVFVALQNEVKKAPKAAAPKKKQRDDDPPDDPAGYEPGYP